MTGFVFDWPWEHDDGCDKDHKTDETCEAHMGPPGPPGPQGPPGEDGEDGTDGVDGTDGSDGVDGSDGTDGTDGTDAEPVNYIMGFARKSDRIDATFWDPSGDGKDIILGRGKGDFIFGLGGDDFVFGGNGRDKIHGGKGDDVCIGGRSRDTYFFATGDGNDKVRMVKNDKLDLSGTAVNGFGDLVMVQTAGGALIDLPGDDSVLLVRRKIDSLDDGDFIF